MDARDIDAWVARYVRAWATNDPADIGGLFTDDASYATAPFRPPWQGRAAIVAGWLDRKDEPGGWTFEPEPAVADGVGFVRGRTIYTEPPTAFRNLWEIRLAPDGRCTAFTEWFMEETAAE